MGQVTLTVEWVLDELAGRPRRDLRVSPRKVRTPQGKVVGNAHPGRPAGQCHRKQTAGCFGTRQG